MDENRRLLVVKIGGTEGVNFDHICLDIQNNKDLQGRLILVHGGSSEATNLGNQVGYPPKFVTSPSGYTSRYTDRKTLDIFIMAVNGKVNTSLIENLQSRGLNAIGLSGLDGRLIIAKRKKAIRIIEDGKQKILRDDFTGKIEEINTKLLNSLLEQGYIPVISPIALSGEGEALNVDADRAAAMIAQNMNAEIVMFLTGAAGLLKDFPDPSSLISEIPFSEIDIYEGFAKGRMRKKILGVKEALQDGVKTAIIGDGRIENPISKALAGLGTKISI